MRSTIDIKSAGALALLTFAAGPARADQRDFVRAYEYATQPEGNLEFELWTDVAAPRGGPFADSLVTHRVELEYGLTDRWDVSLYHVFEHGGPSAEEKAFRFDSWRSETRMRLAEKGEWPVDVMLYAEVERPADFTAPWEIEEKLILGRDFGRVSLVTNLVAEQALAGGQRAEHRFELDLGARYEFAPSVRLGAEVWTIQPYAAEPAAQTRPSYFAGPSVSLASQRVWLQFGTGFGIGDTPESLYLRSVLGFNL